MPLAGDMQNTETATDTTVQALSMYNEPYTLRITKSRNAGNLAARIILEKNHKIVFTKDVDISSFPDTANVTSYSATVLDDIRYDAVRTNRLYFTAILKSTGVETTKGFAIFYKTKKLCQMDHW